VKVPLRCVVGASNEMPKEAELEALYDRFIIRMRVDRLQDEEQLAQFLTASFEYEAPKAELRLTKADLEEAAKLAKALPVEEPVIELLVDLREWCHGKGIKISDRRLGKIKRMLQVAAATSGRETTSLSDAWVVRHCAWDDFTTDQAEKLAEWLDSRVDKQQHNLAGLRALVDAEKKAYFSKAQIQKKDSQGNLIYVNSRGIETTDAEAQGYVYNHTDDNGGSLYTADQIKAKLRADNNGDSYGRINYNGTRVDLEEHFNSRYAGGLKTIKHNPRFENGVYTAEQRERFKASTSTLLERLKAKGGEISGQVDKLTESLELSPWTPKEYQESHVAGLKANLQELEKFQGALQEVITGYDKMLITSDVEKLTDPKA
jgi:hypothetical protein